MGASESNLTRSVRNRHHYPERGERLTVALCCVLFFTLLCSKSYASDLSEEQVRKSVLGLHQLFTKIREVDYGNTHLKIKYTESTRSPSSESSLVSNIIYWSRDGKYFRVDTEVIACSDQNRIGLKTRLIVRPEGFVALENSKAESQLAVVNWGVEADGIDRIQSMDFIGASTRCVGVYEGEIPFGGDKDYQLNKLSNKVRAHYSPISLDNSQSESNLILRTRFKYEEGGVLNSGIYNVTYDITEGTVLRYELEQSESGNNPDELRVVKEYDYTKNKRIPSRIVYRRTNPGAAAKVDYEYVTTEVDWTPVPMGIFSLDNMGGGNVASNAWIRRLIILVFGLSIVGVYAAYRWRTKRG